MCLMQPTRQFLSLQLKWFFFCISDFKSHAVWIISPTKCRPPLWAEAFKSKYRRHKLPIMKRMIKTYSLSLFLFFPLMSYNHLMIVSWLDTFNIRPSGGPLPGIQPRLQHGMWLTVTTKTSLGDFSLTGHKGGSVWSHYKWPQIFSTEHSEVQPGDGNMEVIVFFSKEQSQKLLLSF